MTTGTNETWVIVKARLDCGRSPPFYADTETLFGWVENKVYSLQAHQDNSEDTGMMIPWQLVMIE